MSRAGRRYHQFVNAGWSAGMVHGDLAALRREAKTLRAQRGWVGMKEMKSIEGDEFHNAVFRAYFAEGRNIAKKEVLIDLAGSVGLAEEEADDVLQSRRFKAVVDEDWRLSREWDITAAPTFVLSGERLVGAQPDEVLEGFVRKHHVPERR